MTLSSDSNQYVHRPIPVTQDSHGSKDAATQTEINDASQNFTQHNFTASGDQYIFFAEPNTTYVERPDARGQTNNHGCSYRLLLLMTLSSESDQYGTISVAQDSHGSRDEATQTTINDAGRNASFTQWNFTASGDKYILFVELNATYVERPYVTRRGQTNNHCAHIICLY